MTFKNRIEATLDEIREAGLYKTERVITTPQGVEMLRAFLIDTAGVAADWTPGNFVDQTVAVLVLPVVGFIIWFLAGPRSR